MNRLRFLIGVMAFASVTLTCATAPALFDQWRFTEFFSNADGTVQFIELRCGDFNSENMATVAHIHSSSTNKVFFFPANLPSTVTANKFLFVATDGFESLPGAVMPDFATLTPLPPNFFNPAGDTVKLFVSGVVGAADSRTFPSVPTDGFTSRHYPSNTLTTNTPTNFAGQSGSIDLSLLPGDYNDDGTVDAADYVVWRANLGTTNTIPNDLTPHWVMEDDYTVWRANFGSTAAGGGSLSSVPEPTSLLLILILGALHYVCSNPVSRACRSRAA